MLRVAQEAYKASQLITSAISGEFGQFENGGRRGGLYLLCGFSWGDVKKNSFHSRRPPTTDKQGFHPGLAS